MSMSARELNGLLEIAENAARSSVRAVVNNRPSVRRVERSSMRDVKIAADRLLESAIAKYLAARTDIPVLSEEGGDIVKGRPGMPYRWIVDPMDGSLNFSRGIPLCAVSIALWKGMEPVLGVIYDLNRGETFKGMVGAGAMLNGKPIKVSAVDKKRNAILATGFPAGANFSRQNITDAVNDFRAYKKVRLFGSAAISLAYVASGRVDRYEEDGIKLWDVAAGLAIVKAAGGAVRISRSGAGDKYNVKAANRGLLR